MRPETTAIQNQLRKFNLLGYADECDGNIEEFTQIERLFLDNKEVYKAYFIGGRVNVQK